MTKIDWCDETINPLGWGCYGPGGTPETPKVCSYCYARRMAHREVRDCELCRQFIPHWHPEMLDKPHHWRHPRKIFVQSMGDLFHDCSPEFHIELVMDMVKVLPRHTFIFLTKNPKRLKDFNPWPPNCWVGTTITCQDDMHRVMEMWNVLSKVRFISYEPLMGPIDIGLSGAYIDWAIIGAMTGPGAVKPKPEWVHGLLDQYRVAGVPCFVKDNLRDPMGWTANSIIPWPQEYPA